jgi:Ser/Thr protein kinase RdoA (MazF antagonist)
VTEALEELELLRSTSAAEELMELLADEGFARTRRMISSTVPRIARLGAFPQGLLHHDLVRSNLSACTPAMTSAIDWENVGRGPLGVDLAPLVVGSVRRGEASADDLPELERVVLSGYEDGLSAAGLDDAGAARTAYRLALGLRWHVVLGTIRSWSDPTSVGMRGSRPEETRNEALRHLVVLSRHLLGASEPAD